MSKAGQKDAALTDLVHDGNQLLPVAFSSSDLILDVFTPPTKRITSIQYLKHIDNISSQRRV